MNRRLLIVEDDRQVALALSIRLRAAGYTLDLAHDGEAALTHLRSGPRPDVVLLDIRLPGIDGIGVAQRMQTHDGWATIPIVFLSANAQERVKHTALNAGGRYFLEKPFEARVLLDTLERVFDAAAHPAVGTDASP